ncbi:MAG: HEAT repeat domain-containing protein, partial [Planctomycetota bacterium]
MDMKVAGVIIVVLALSSPVGLAVGAETEGICEEYGPAVGGLRLRISAIRRQFQQWESIDIKLVFQNAGSETMVLLPGSLDFKVEGPGAWYSSHPGEVPPFHGQVQVLEPGRLAVYELIDLDDGGGRWVVKPGTCQMKASYAVRSAKWHKPVPPGRVWTGKVEAKRVKIKVVPNSPMHDRLMELFEPLRYEHGPEKVRPQLEVLGDEADRELLLMLGDRGFSNRRAVAWCLGVRKVKEAVPGLIAHISTDDATVYSDVHGAVDALGEIGDQRAFKALARLLPGMARFDEVRPSVLRALWKIGDGRAIPIFRRYAEHEDWKTAGQALAGLYVVAEEDVVTPLLDDILANETATRQQSHDRLKAMGPAAAPKLLEIYRASVEPARIAKTGAFLELIMQHGHYEKAVTEAALEKLDSNDPAVRELAPYILRSAEPCDVVVNALIEALEDDNDEVRDGAARVLGEFKERRAVGPLLEMARDHSRKSDEYAVWPLLYNFKDPQIDAVLIAEFDKAGHDYRVRLASCVGTLAAHGETTDVAVRWLEKIAADDSLGDIAGVA